MFAPIPQLGTKPQRPPRTRDDSSFSPCSEYPEEGIGVECATRKLRHSDDAYGYGAAQVLFSLPLFGIRAPALNVHRLKLIGFAECRWLIGPAPSQSASLSAQLDPQEPTAHRCR